jgi:hypothetical protein
VRSNGDLPGESREPILVEVESKVEHEEVPKKEAAVKLVGALKKRHGDQHLVVGNRKKPKEWTQGDGGSWTTLAAACRGMNRRSIPARRKRHSKDKAIPRTQKGQMFRKRHQVKMEGINGIRIQGLQKHLHLRSEITSGRIFRKTIGLEIVKQIAGSSVRIWKMRNKTLRRNRTPPK